MKVKTLSKSHCYRLVRLVVAGNCGGNCNCWDGEPIWCVFLYKKEIVYFIYVIRYLMVLVNVIYVITTQYMITYTEVCYLVNRLHIQFSVLYNPNSWLLTNKALNIFSSCLCFIQYLCSNHNHDTKEAFMGHLLPVFLHAYFNPL
jgi:hypothetical protein